MTAGVDDIVEQRMPFSEHVRELRTRMLWSLSAIGVCFAIAWVFHEQVFAWLMAPYAEGVAAVHPEVPQLLQFRSLVEPVVVYLKTSLLVAMIGAAPIILYQIWMFVAPGLYARERRVALPFLLASVVCFFGGVAFCRYLILEPAIVVLLKMGGVNTSAAIMMQEYFSFTSILLFAFGVFFELPVVLSFLSLLEVVTARFLWRNFRYAIVIAFVVAALMPTPDVFTQTAMALPLIALYTLSIGIAWLIERSRRTAAPAEGL